MDYFVNKHTLHSLLRILPEAIATEFLQNIINKYVVPELKTMMQDNGIENDIDLKTGIDLSTSYELVKSFSQNSMIKLSILVKAYKAGEISEDEVQKAASVAQRISFLRNSFSLLINKRFGNYLDSAITSGISRFLQHENLQYTVDLIFEEFRIFCKNEDIDLDSLIIQSNENARARRLKRNSLD